MYIDSFARFGVVRKREQYGSCFREAISDLFDIDFSENTIPNNITGYQFDALIEEMYLYCYLFEDVNNTPIYQPVIAIVKQPNTKDYHAVYVVPDQMGEFRLYCKRHQTEIRWIISKDAL